MKEIKLYGVISNEGFLGMGENGYIERIANEIKAAGDEDINLRINTPGGSVFDGYAIITNLLEHEGKVNMQIDGGAISMGGAILAYADYATAYDFTKVMLHKARGGTEDIRDVLNGDIARLFKSKAQKRDIDNSELMDEIFLSEENKDYWFSAQEAKDIGLVDEVLDSDQVQKAAATSMDIINKYYELINQKREVVMFNSKEELKKVKASIQDLLDNINSFVTNDEVVNLTKEEGEKVTDTINKENQKKFDEMNQETEKTGLVLSELSETLQKLNESIETLQKSNTENAEKLTELDKKIDSTVEAIKGVVTDFVVPEAVDNLKVPDVPVSKDSFHATLNKNLNEFNAERK